MSASSITPNRIVINRPHRSRWLILLAVMIATEIGLLFWRFVPAGIPLLVAEQILPVSEKLAWYLTRSSGTIAYITLTLSTVWGLLLSTKLVKAWVPPAVALTMHNSLAWIGIGLSFFHAFFLLFDRYFTYSVANLLVPFTGPYQPFWVGMGTLSFYLALIISASFYIRHRIGTKTWRRFHYLTFALFFMVTAHGWMAGSDSTQLLPLYLVSGNLVLFLTFYRILDAIQSGRRKIPSAVGHQ